MTLGEGWSNLVVQSNAGDGDVQVDLKTLASGKGSPSFLS